MSDDKCIVVFVPTWSTPSYVSTTRQFSMGIINVSSQSCFAILCDCGLGALISCECFPCAKVGAAIIPFDPIPQIFSSQNSFHTVECSLVHSTWRQARAMLSLSLSRTSMHWFPIVATKWHGIGLSAAIHRLFIDGDQLTIEAQQQLTSGEGVQQFSYEDVANHIPELLQACEGAIWVSAWFRSHLPILHYCSDVVLEKYKQAFWFSLLIQKVEDFLRHSLVHC